MKKLSAICGLAACLLGAHSAAVNAASTVFTPTDGDVNFIALPNPPVTGSIDLTGTRMVAIFDDTDITFSGSYAWVLNSSYSSTVAVFTGANPTNVAVKPNSTGSTLNFTNLNGDDKFIVGYYNGTSWVAETGITSLGADSYYVSFADGSFIEVDAAVVPVPAAAWLFGTGLVGLIGVARRKQR